MMGTDITARADIVSMHLTVSSTLIVIDIKTGPNSRIEGGQSWVYPGLVHGDIVMSPDPKISVFGLTPGQPLPPIPGWIYYSPGSSLGGTPFQVPSVFPFNWRPPGSR